MRTRSNFTTLSKISKVMFKLYLRRCLRPRCKRVISLSPLVYDLKHNDFGLRKMLSAVLIFSIHSHNSNG